MSTKFTTNDESLQKMINSKTLFQSLHINNNLSSNRQLNISNNKNNLSSSKRLLFSMSDMHFHESVDSIFIKTPKKKESLFKVTLIFIRMCIQVRIFIIPYYLKKFGVFQSICLFLLAACFHYLAFSLLAEVGNDTKINNYAFLVEFLAPSWLKKDFKNNFNDRYDKCNNFSTHSSL